MYKTVQREVMKNILYLTVAFFILTVVIMNHIGSERATIIEQRHAEIAERDAKLEAERQAKEEE